MHISSLLSSWCTVVLVLVVVNCPATLSSWVSASPPGWRSSHLTWTTPERRPLSSSTTLTLSWYGWVVTIARWCWCLLFPSIVYFWRSKRLRTVLFLTKLSLNHRLACSHSSTQNLSHSYNSSIWTASQDSYGMRMGIIEATYLPYRLALYAKLTSLIGALQTFLSIFLLSIVYLVQDHEQHMGWFLKPLPNKIRVVLTASEDNYPDSWRYMGEYTYMSTCSCGPHDFQLPLVLTFNKPKDPVLSLAHMCLLVRNGMVNEIEFLGPITEMWRLWDFFAPILLQQWNLTSLVYLTFEQVMCKMLWTLLGCTSCKTYASPRNSTSFTRPFFLIRGWGLGTRLGNKWTLQLQCKTHNRWDKGTECELCRGVYVYHMYVCT